MKRLLIAASAACLLMACTAGGGQKPGTPGAKAPKKNPVIVVLDVEKIIKESAPSKQIQADLSAWAESAKSQIQAKAQEVDKAQAEKRPAKEIEALKMATMQMQQAAREEFQKRQNEASDKMREVFNPVVDALAKENGWDVVLNKTDQVTIWTSDAMDQTDLVLQRLNSLSTPKAPAAPAKP